MAVHLAKRTLDAINTSLEKDQGATYRKFLGQVIPHIGDAYRGEDKNPYRSHMGASGIGKDCARAIWYSFRWFTRPQFEGRILRLLPRRIVRLRDAGAAIVERRVQYVRGCIRPLIRKSG